MFSPFLLSRGLRVTPEGARASTADGKEPIDHKSGMRASDGSTGTGTGWGMGLGVGMTPGAADQLQLQFQQQQLIRELVDSVASLGAEVRGLRSELAQSRRPSTAIPRGATAHSHGPTRTAHAHVAAPTPAPSEPATVPLAWKASSRSL